MKDLLDEIMGFYRWFIKFITLDIWNLNINDFGKAKRRFIRYLKVAIITIKKSGNDKLGLYAVSLSFFSTMAVVPFAAVAFVVTGGLGLERRLQELLLESFSENTEVLQWVIQFADNIVASSRQGLFGVISFIFFIGTVVWLILSIEKAFNDIWKV
ncbi:MAG: YhjD/YihY/BrkB family envelope integrity protein, partial [Bacteroidales bacterium]